MCVSGLFQRPQGAQGRSHVSRWHWAQKATSTWWKEKAMRTPGARAVADRHARTTSGVPLARAEAGVAPEA
eukprot:8947375-Alexandrium_andersonii.AAC.1